MGAISPNHGPWDSRWPSYKIQSTALGIAWKLYCGYRLIWGWDPYPRDSLEHVILLGVQLLVYGIPLWSGADLMPLACWKYPSFCGFLNLSRIFDTTHSFPYTKVESCYICIHNKTNMSHALRSHFFILFPHIISLKIKTIDTNPKWSSNSFLAHILSSTRISPSEQKPNPYIYAWIPLKSIGSWKSQKTC